ncbi:DUF6912 family protein [Demequina sediminicola]|uniref:DUF6912 family protein n=1 Tax=Demequina sediminicola TaxID=1095026 RepID=UPI00078237C9|nr:hypothetical protein [Demequina sediminicola]
MRVYIPASFDDLETCLTGLWSPGDAFAVTDQLLDITALDDDDEVAEQVRDVAALTSVARRGVPLRVVIVADCPRLDVEELAGEHPAAVRINGRVDGADVVCAFVDELAAADAVSDATTGSAEALEALADHELLWWDVSEFDQIPRP